MAQTNLSNYKNLYLQTAKEYIDSLLAGYNKLVSDSQDKDAINNLHIASHSLKSQSQVMGFMDITVLSGAIEKKSRDILFGIAQTDDKFIIFLKDSVNKLNLELSKIEKGDAEIHSA